MSSFGASLRALFGRIGLAVALCAAVAVSAVVVVNRYIDGKVDSIPRVALDTAPVGSNGMNFLIIGSDSRSFVDNAIDYQAFSDKNTQNAPPRSDTMMVLHANGDHSFAVSFPRDLWVDIPGKGSAKLNAAFNDGPQKVVDTLATDFNVPVNHYLEVDFATFEKIVDAIGRIPVWVPGIIKDDYTGLGALPGCNWFDGAHSLQWVRARNIQIYDPKGTYDPGTKLRWRPLDSTADIGRIKRQQDFVRKLGRIAVERTLNDPLLAPDLVDAIFPNLHADKSFDRGAFDALVSAFKSLASGGPGVEFETLPWDGPATRGGQSVVLVKQPDAGTVFARLRGEVVTEQQPPPTTPASAASTIQPSDVRVRVLNASGVAGAAGSADQQLSNRGFVSGGVGNYTGTAVQKTEIRYRPEDAPKAQLLAGSVTGAALVPDSTLVGGDVLLVIGPNFKGVGASVPKDTATPVAPTITPEEACDQAG